MFVSTTERLWCISIKLQSYNAILILRRGRRFFPQITDSNVAWKPVKISLSCMFHLLRRLGLAGLPFKLISSRSRHVSLLWLFVSLQFCPVQHIKLTKLRSNCTTRQRWPDMNQDSVTALPISRIKCFQKQSDWLLAVCFAPADNAPWKSTIHRAMPD